MISRVSIRSCATVVVIATFVVICLRFPHRLALSSDLVLSSICGAHVTHMNGQNIQGTPQGIPCSENISLGEAPLYTLPVVGHPDMRGGGRRDPFLVLHYQKPTVSSAPDSTVVMSVYNAGPALSRSLPSLFSLTGGSWELIIVLDACYDSSYDVAVQMISKHFPRSSCARVRVYVQPTAVWEVSSDNIGMRVADASAAFILHQADNILLEKNWNLRMLQHLTGNPALFSISGRCAHSFDGSDSVGRCQADIATPLPEVELFANKLFIRETGNRGPLMLRAELTRQLGYLNEGAYLLENDDHDLNRRAGELGYRSSYLPIGSYAPIDLSARRNSEFRKHTPQEIAEEESRYKQYRLELARKQHTDPSRVF